MFARASFSNCFGGLAFRGGNARIRPFQWRRVHSRRPFSFVFQLSRHRPAGPCATGGPAALSCLAPGDSAESACSPKNEAGKENGATGFPIAPPFGILKFYCFGVARGQEGRPANFSNINKEISSIAQSYKDNFTTEYAGIFSAASDSTRAGVRDKTFPYVRVMSIQILRNVLKLDV